MQMPNDPADTDDLPPVDARLVAPESGYEIDDGKLVYVAPADPPHAIAHGALGALLRAHCAADRTAAIDMLTRTSKTSYIAPDGSIFPTAPDPKTGGRQIEELAFEVLTTTTLSEVAGRARQLAKRGVRRVFALDCLRRRAFEWSRDLDTWSILAPDARIEDRALAVPLPLDALVDAAKADLATIRAFRAQRHPEFIAEREEGRQEGREEGRQEGREEGRHEERAAMLRTLLATKFGASAAAFEDRIARATPEQLARYLERLLTATSAADVFDR
jgi:hypothetical protein